jgi:hypothetical protein
MPDAAWLLSRGCRVSSTASSPPMASMRLACLRAPLAAPSCMPFILSGRPAAAEVDGLGTRVSNEKRARTSVGDVPAETFLGYCPNGR